MGMDRSGSLWLIRDFVYNENRAWFGMDLKTIKKGKTTIGKIFSAKAIPNDIPDRFNLFLNNW